MPTTLTPAQVRDAFKQGLGAAKLDPKARALEAELNALSGKGRNTACVQKRLKRKKTRLDRALR